jgi:H+/Cl- antiporter ClcA
MNKLEFLQIANFVFKRFLLILKQKLKHSSEYVKVFFKWTLISLITGIIGGFVGSMFHKGIEFVTLFRFGNSWIIFLLPFAGLVIISLYRISKVHENTGTNIILDSVRTKSRVNFLITPLIFITSIITHLCGGSAGREGAALQLGGSIGSQIGKFFNLDLKDMSIIILCGMSSVFSALFGVPITSTFFALEVISIGVIYYSGLVPCIFSALIAYNVSLFFKISPIKYSIPKINEFNYIVFFKVIVLASMAALVSIIFCVAMKKVRFVLVKVFKNEYLRIFTGGLIIVILTILVGTKDYNGTGMNIIFDAINGHAKAEAFLLKIIFTAITIGAGFKGGEIVPTFFIGATFGCVAGSFFGLNPGFAAAIGLVSVFCGVVNAPLASIFLSLELFGPNDIIFFVVACCVSYMLSGYYGLYSSQKIVYSKYKAEFINRNAK